jgi:hypothetical protein
MVVEKIKMTAGCLEIGERVIDTLGEGSPASVASL